MVKQSLIVLVISSGLLLIGSALIWRAYRHALNTSDDDSTKIDDANTSMYQYQSFVFLLSAIVAWFVESGSCVLLLPTYSPSSLESLAISKKENSITMLKKFVGL